MALNQNEDRHETTRQPLYSVEFKNSIGPEPIHIWVSDRVEVIVFRDGEKLRAFHSICPHMGASLELSSDRRGIFCPWHGLKFSLETCKSDHARYLRIREYECELKEGKLILYG